MCEFMQAFAKYRSPIPTSKKIPAEQTARQGLLMIQMLIYESVNQHAFGCVANFDNVNALVGHLEHGTDAVIDITVDKAAH